MPQFGQPGECIGYEVYPHPQGAPPILLIHGFTASSASFANNIAPLNELFTVVTVDLLGHGESDSPADVEAYGPDRAVARLTGLMDELGYQRALVCGHSLGGALALRLALDAPDRVAGLIVINSNSAAGSAKWREEVQPRLEEMATRIRAEGIAFLKDSRLYPASSKRIPQPIREQLALDFDSLQPEGVAGTAEGLIARVNAFERLPELTVPTLVVVGTRDAEFVRNAPRMVASLRRNVVQMVNLEGAGHAANLEQPDSFEAAVEEFATECGYLGDPKKDERRRTMLYMIIGGLLSAIIFGGISAYIIVNRGDDKAALPIGVTATATSNGPAKPTTPGAAGTPTVAATTARTTPAGGTATATPAAPTPTPPVPTPTNVTQPTPTQRPPTPIPPTPVPPTPEQPTPTPTTPAATPTSTATATATPTATATATPSGPSASIVGPSTVSGLTAGFGVSINPSNYLKISWSSSGGSISGDGGPSISVSFPSAGCYSVSVTVLFENGSASSSHSVGVGGSSC